MPKDFTVIGRALSAPARSDIVNVLMDGSTRPATELASAAGVSASTASEHLTVLVDAGMLVVEAVGRRRLYRLADGGIAGALEHLGQLCPPTEEVTYHRGRDARRLADARLCYDHLAGRLGVAVTDTLIERRLIDEDFALTARGTNGLVELGIDIPGIEAGRRRLTRQCLDWTERRPHLAGALGAAIAGQFLTSHWVEKDQPRGLRLTAAGRSALVSVWKVPETALPPRR